MMGIYPIDFKRMDAEKLIPDLPDEKDMTVEQRAFYLKGYEAGWHDGQRRLKQEVTREFQLAVFKHVL